MSKRSGKQKPLLDNHQRSWLWGRHIVKETLLAGEWPIHELRLSENLPEELSHELRVLADTRRIPLEVNTAKRLEQLCGQRQHQGVLARMGPFPHVPFAEVIEQAPRRILLLDGIQDAFNFGSILRNAAAFGFEAVIIPTRDQSGVNSHVARSSAGGINHLRIAQVEDFVGAARGLREAGYHIVATMMEGEPIHEQHASPDRIALVIGNEHAGVRPEVAELANAKVAIPMTGKVESLNAAVAAGILMQRLAVTL